jgi:DnaJ-class molecular chaperone
VLCPITPAAYRKACLEHHPDKKLVGVDCDKAKVEAEEHFKKVSSNCMYGC